MASSCNITNQPRPISLRSILMPLICNTNNNALASRDRSPILSVKMCLGSSKSKLTPFLVYAPPLIRYTPFMSIHRSVCKTKSSLERRKLNVLNRINFGVYSNLAIQLSLTSNPPFLSILIQSLSLLMENSKSPTMIWSVNNTDLQ